jgi:TM2 domain-containing membrane protein YozV
MMAEQKIDLAMLAVLKTPMDDAIIFRWAKEQLGGEGEKLQKFQQVYLERKKEKSTAHILNLLGFIGLGGLHRFYLGDIGLGIAMLLTVGFCGVGTVVDIININQRVNQANTRVAMQTLEIVRAMG